MTSPARVDKLLTLEEFLRLPEIDEHPYLEYVDGRIEAGALQGEPVLVGYCLPIADLFDWLTLRRPKSLPPSRPGPSAPGDSAQ